MFAPFGIEGSLEDVRYLFAPYFEQTDDYADWAENFTPELTEGIFMW